jgi:Acyl-CoA dehydrogenase, C-terminal domain
VRHRQPISTLTKLSGSATVYANTGLERCLRDIRTAGQHVVVVPSNYEMVGQALLDFDMRSTLLLAMDDRGAG